MKPTATFNRYYRRIEAFQDNQNHPVLYDNYGGVTLYVERYDYDDGKAPDYLVSFAITSDKDRFEKKRGRELAQSRFGKEDSLTLRVNLDVNDPTDNIYNAVLNNVDGRIVSLTEGESTPSMKKEKRMLELLKKTLVDCAAA